MEIKYSVHINLFKGKKKIGTYGMCFKNRPISGDYIRVEDIINGEAEYYIQCKTTKEYVYKMRAENEKIIKENAIKLKDKAKVEYVYIHPIVGYSCVDYTVDVFIGVKTIKT